MLLEVIISGTRAGLGIRIVGGINTTSSDEFGIFVKEVIQGSLAARDGEFVHNGLTQYTTIITHRSSPERGSTH